MAGGHGSSNKAVIAALLANSGIAVAKFVGFIITGSSSMLAESVHSVADSGNQGLLLLGGARARKEATETHPFGHGRERYFWAFIVTLVLFTLGAVFALYEGIEKLREPHAVESVGVAVGILAFAIVVESLSLRTAVVEANKVRGDASWVHFLRHSRSPELPVVLLEDIGAEVGLFLALGGVGLTLLTGDPVWDAYATVSIGVLLGVIAIVLCIEMKSLLIGEGASVADLGKVRDAITTAPGVSALIHLKTQHLGPEELLVAAKLSLDASLSFPEVAATIDEVERRIRDQVPIARVIYLEPDVVDQPLPA